MKCPVCSNVNLVMSERQGVEIDYCPDCRGVWLDRGELDKIIERAASREASPQPAKPAAQQDFQPCPPHYRQEHDHLRRHGSDHAHGHGYGHGGKPYRKKSFLEELFD